MRGNTVSEEKPDAIFGRIVSILEEARGNRLDVVPISGIIDR